MFKSTVRILKFIENENIKNKIKLAIDGGNYSMFFRYKGKIFAANENNRVTFAKLADDNDEDNDPAWRKYTHFTACDLNDALAGKQENKIFSYNDIKEIQVITDKERLKEELTNLVHEKS